MNDAERAVRCACGHKQAGHIKVGTGHGRCIFCSCKQYRLRPS